MAFHNFPYTDAHELNLDWVLTNLKTWIHNYSDILANIGVMQSDIDSLEKAVDKINSGIFPDNVWANFRYWFDTYAKPKIVELIGDSIKLVWFGLTDDGYFVAYIPESWDEITFDTVMDYASEYYGHLVLVHTESINNIPVWQGGDY